jgi:dihydroxy-acid dehydratase
MSNESDKSTRKYSSIVVDGVEQAPSRALLRAVGFKEEVFYIVMD